LEIIVVLLFAYAKRHKGDVGRQLGEWFAPKSSVYLDGCAICIKVSKILNGHRAYIITLPQGISNANVIVRLLFVAPLLATEPGVATKEQPLAERDY
jgi:hypothetical protein